MYLGAALVELQKISVDLELDLGAFLFQFRELFKFLRFRSFKFIGD